MIRVDPGDPFDGVGWSGLGVNAKDTVDNEYIMWGRKEVFAQSDADSSLSQPEILHGRIADNLWPY
jgi:hypothetical protein